jgi:hypothetical protein
MCLYFMHYIEVDGSNSNANWLTIYVLSMAS